MRWLLRLGLGGDNNTRTSYDQMVVTDPVQFHVALELAKRVGDEMLNFAIAKCQRVRPLELGGDDFARSMVKADFAARVLTCAGEFCYLSDPATKGWKYDPANWPKPGISDHRLGKVDVVVGPESQSLEWALALGAGKEAVQHGVSILSKRLQKYLAPVRV
jgi:hypothetical protein